MQVLIKPSEKRLAQELRNDAQKMYLNRKKFTKFGRKQDTNTILFFPMHFL
jgi:hypothetical protein